MLCPLSVKTKRENARKDGEPVLRDETLELLLKIAAEKRPASILEIGTNVGLTGVALLLTLKNATLTGIEIDEDLYNAAKSNYAQFGVADRAKIFLGDASEIIPVMTGKYDLIFLDGPKGHYYEYLPYLKAALNENGVLFADDVAFHGYVDGVVPRKHRAIVNSLKAFLSDLKNDADFTVNVYDLEDGVCVSEKKCDE